jgi:hypothetical protein
MINSCHITVDDITYRFIIEIEHLNKEGVELFQIGKDKTGSITYNTVFIKDNNSVAASSGDGDNRCILIIDIESQKVMTTISMDSISIITGKYHSTI